MKEDEDAFDKEEELTQKEIDENNKTIFQFQGQVSSILMPLRKYGQEDYVLMVIPEIVSLAYQLGYKLHYGVDVPFELSDHFKHMLMEVENW